MKTTQARTVLKTLPVALLCLASGPLWAGTEGTSSTFYGYFAGASASGSSGSNTMLGAYAGYNAAGFANTFLGSAAGFNTSTGNGNTYVGDGAGNNANGDSNVFLGFQAGYSEQGSNRLYIDNCFSGGVCSVPFIYGEFDNHLLRINGVTHAAANNVAKSQMHFSLNNADSGGFLTSVLENNFFVSSGARYDGTAGGWIQRSTDGNAVIAGSGGVGYRIFTHNGTPSGGTFTPTLRVHIDYSGQIGINTAPVAGHEIHASSGAHLTSGGVWTDASSREYKDNIRPLSTEQALQTLNGLDPVLYSYKVNPEEQHVGFIAEDVPELVAREDRKSLSPMDIVAVLTKVVQEQARTLAAQGKLLERQQQSVEATRESMAARIAQLEAEVGRLKQKEVVARQ